MNKPQKYKSGEVLMTKYGRLILIIGHSTTGHDYLCEKDDELVWIADNRIEKLEKIGRS